MLPKGNGFSWPRGLLFWFSFSKCFSFYNLIFNVLRVNLTRFCVWFCIRNVNL